MGIIYYMSGHIQKAKQKNDYKLEEPADFFGGQHAIIRGFGVSSVPVTVDGRILYDTSVVKDGRLLYWNTRNSRPETLEQILEDFEFCQMRYSAENGIHGTYFDNVNTDRRVVDMYR